MKSSADLLVVDLSEDFVVKFEEHVEEVFGMLIEMPLEERRDTVDALIELYITNTKENPSEDAVSRLTHALLWDYMEGDRRPDKMTLTDEPIMTDSQYNLRTRGTSRKASAGGQSIHEVGLDPTYLASDGRDYRIPVRRYD